MNRRTAVGAIISAIFVIGVLAVYSFETASSRTITLTTTVTAIGTEQIGVVPAVGRQAVLCTATATTVPGTVTSTSGNTPATTTFARVQNGTSFVYTVIYGQTTIESYVYVSATNATNSIGYVTTRTMTSLIGLGGAVTDITCTYLP